MNILDMQANAVRASTLMKALGNENRLMILCQLSDGEKSVGQLEGLIGLSQSALSQHLSRLRRDDLVATRREGQTIHYSLSGREARQVIDLLYDIFCRPSTPAAEIH